MPPNGRASPTASPGITRAEVLSLLDVQKNALCDTLDHIARSNNEAIDRVLRMNNDATAKIGELTKSLEFAHHQLEDLKPIIDNLKRNNAELIKENEQIKKENNEMKERIDYLDDYSRRNNLRISGLPEDKNETWEKSQSKAAAFLQRHFQLTPEFERVHRVGTLTRNAAPRDIVVRFTRYTDRDAVFQDRRKLANTRTGVYINEDLCRNSLEMRKAQMPALRAAKRDGKVAYFNYRKSLEHPRAHRPCTQPHSSSSVTLVFPPPGFADGNAKSTYISRDASSATLSASSATDVDAATTLTETSGAFLASTSVSVASNAMDASGATDADDAPGATHDAAASIATDSSSSTIAAGAVGATTGGLPPRSSHTTSNQQTHKLGTTHDRNAGMALRSKPTGTRKKQL
ncbi:hypothetical protein C7M84_011688 [Penaeus vannamei]|uniref:Uncharacterized protein n=1 Tax=Penaeus vannamei TaxID=6689 RepID=A0A423UA21_PENVA|nr:hypothetical protein C7M84_011688 [Penaeus vannamei]